MSCFALLFLTELFNQSIKSWTHQNKFCILFSDYRTHHPRGLLFPIHQVVMVYSKGFLRFTLVLSILVGTITPLCQEWFDKSEVDVELPENWKRMSIQEKLDNFDGLFSKKATFLLLPKIKQLNIRKQLKKMIVDKEDEVLRDGFKYSFTFRFYVGWEELGLLGLLGFASVWIIYGVVRVATLLIPTAPIIHFPSAPLRGQLESLYLPIWQEPVGVASVRLTLFGFLALEEGPKRPKKPGAVWID